MLRWISMLGLSALAGCKGCSTEAPHGKNATSTSVTVEAPSVDADVPTMGATYQEAYELAKKEVTKDNAEDELDTLEHDIDKGM